jgi:hypothetical protein
MLLPHLEVSSSLGENPGSSRAPAAAAAVAVGGGDDVATSLVAIVLVGCSMLVGVYCHRGFRTRNLVIIIII